MCIPTRDAREQEDQTGEGCSKVVVVVEGKEKNSRDLLKRHEETEHLRNAAVLELVSVVNVDIVFRKCEFYSHCHTA